MLADYSANRALGLWPGGIEAPTARRHHKLISASREVAERMLREHGEFFPYGALMRPDGQIVSVSSTTGEERPASTALISILRDGYRREAVDGKILACAVVYDVRVATIAAPQMRDAVAFAIDHRDGYSVEVFFPYALHKSGELVFEPPFAKKGADEIFPR